ncbi:phosphotransferase [Sinorhizobium meliloti]|nr:phosphotransferase [Sinorhizobium meliloti]MDX0271316.1 phosphotransferase [Sinorhizobium meliloti]
MSRRHAGDEILLPKLPTGREWTPVRHGESGDRVYRRSDGGAYAKIASGKAAALLEGERDRVAWLAPFRLGSPSVCEWIAADEACLVISALPGVPASELSAVDLKKAWPSILRQLKLLHELPTEACPFGRRLASMFDRAADVVRRDAVNPDFLAPEDQNTPPGELLDALRAELPRHLIDEPSDLVICHGDACLPNFMVDPDTHRCTGVIDLGRLGTAEPGVRVGVGKRYRNLEAVTIDTANCSANGQFDAFDADLAALELITNGAIASGGCGAGSKQVRIAVDEAYGTGAPAVGIILHAGFVVP